VTGYGVAIPAKGIGINRKTSDFLRYVHSGNSGSVSRIRVSGKNKTRKGADML